MDEWKDVNRILLGNPWIFRNSWLVVKEWQRDHALTSTNFQTVPIWVQRSGVFHHTAKLNNLAIKSVNVWEEFLKRIFLNSLKRRQQLRLKLILTSLSQLKPGSTLAASKMVSYGLILDMKSSHYFASYVASLAMVKLAAQRTQIFRNLMLK